MEAEKVSLIGYAEQEQIFDNDGGLLDAGKSDNLFFQQDDEPGSIVGKEEVQPELSPITIEDIKVAEEVESRIYAGQSSSSKTVNETAQQVFEGFGHLTIDDENFIRKIEYEYAKKGSCSKPAIKRDYYYSVASIARDVAILEDDGPSFDLGLTQQDNIDEKDDQNRDFTPEERLSNMITRMKNERRKIVVPIRMRDYVPFGETKPKPKILKKVCVKTKNTTPIKVTSLKVKLKPVDRLKIIKNVLNEDQKTIVCRYFKENFESDKAWECQKFGLHISGRMLNDLVRKGNVSQYVIEFYMMKLHKHIENGELKADGTLKYNRAVFLSTYACVLHEMGRNCVGAIERFIEKMDYGVRFLIIPLLTKLGQDIYHWTLLDFDNEAGEFYHYNSMKSTEAKCRRTALSMKKRVVSAFRDHVAELEEPVSQDNVFEMLTPSCCEQKGLLKGNMKSHEENISEKVESMRAKLCYKILVDKTLKEI
ncbi:hypothetical protein MKW92_016452 [Papaver armeniacum]|nr:hypothetical protein MKW92_016452 [Papaver armeniacum]